MLPSSADEMRALGLTQLDVILVTGDPHVDHPSFPAALLGRVLQAAGFSVGVIARPRVDSLDDLTRLGRPRLMFGVTSGALDSMVANYTALGKRRHDDPYSPGGLAGSRPDRALTVYCQLLRRAYSKQVMIVAGGLEASLRRFAHYDFWSGAVRRSILMDCGADALIHSMGELAVVKLARRLDRLGEDRRCRSDARLETLVDVAGLVWRTPKSEAIPKRSLALPPSELVATDPLAQVDAFNVQHRQAHRQLCQDVGGMRVIANPAARLSTAQLDGFYQLPFSRNAHPIYRGAHIPALEQVRFSVTSHRGCAGGCAFCAISAHQGRCITSRSQDSVLAEIERIVRHPEFHGTVPDVGGPSANMYGFSCARKEPCQKPSCLWPTRCKHLKGEQRNYIKLLKEAKSVTGVRHLFVSTGLRMDLALECKDMIAQLAREHVSGHLKVAPEHFTPRVLDAMRKPSAACFLEFLKEFQRCSRKAGRKQYLLPYLMAAHPGCRMEDMIEVSLILREKRIPVEQVQIFTPTPGTAATLMYATGLDPRTREKIFVERNPRQKRLQKALLLSHLPENQSLVKEALSMCGRKDLFCALRPQGKSPRNSKSKDKETGKRSKPSPLSRNEPGVLSKNRPNG
jgi:uncharacterized radical SAM protein YgiQ